MTETAQGAATSYRVLVCGGRNYGDHRTLFAVLDEVHAARPISLIIHGACIQRGLISGADRWAEAWARACEIPYLGVPARWNAEGNRAGPLRNFRMLNEHKPDLVIGFPGGKGTAGMLELARKAGIDRRIVP